MLYSTYQTIFERHGCQMILMYLACSVYSLNFIDCGARHCQSQWIISMLGISQDSNRLLSLFNSWATSLHESSILLRIYVFIVNFANLINRRIIANESISSVITWNDFWMVISSWHSFSICYILNSRMFLFNRVRCKWREVYVYIMCNLQGSSWMKI